MTRDLFGQPITPPKRPPDSEEKATFTLEVHEVGIVAWEVSRPGSMRRFSLPRSLCTRDGPDFTMPRWIARDRGLM